MKDEQGSTEFLSKRKRIFLGWIPMKSGFRGSRRRIDCCLRAFDESNCMKNWKKQGQAAL